MSPASTTKAAKRTPAKAAATKPASTAAVVPKSATSRAAAKRAKPATAQSRALTDTIFDGYTGAPSFGRPYDEMFDANGDIRPAYRGIFKAMAESDRADIETRIDALGRAFIDQGVTFSLSGKERPFPLDVVPRVISAAEWHKLEGGIAQRVQALELFLDDVYGTQEILRDGVLPKRLVHS